MKVTRNLTVPRGSTVVDFLDPDTTKRQVVQDSDRYTRTYIACARRSTGDGGSATVQAIRPASGGRGGR